MGKSTGKNTIWTESELDLLDMYSTLPSITDLALLLDKGYALIKQKVNDTRKKLNIRGIGGTGHIDVGCEHGHITNQNLLDIEKSNKRAMMVARLSAGQQLIVRDEGQMIPQKVTVLANNGNFITCKQIANNRILTLSRGSIISRKTLVGVISDF